MLQLCSGCTKHERVLKPLGHRSYCFAILCRERFMRDVRPQSARLVQPPTPPSLSCTGVTSILTCFNGTFDRSTCTQGWVCVFQETNFEEEISACQFVTLAAKNHPILRFKAARTCPAHDPVFCFGGFIDLPSQPAAKFTIDNTFISTSWHKT